MTLAEVEIIASPKNKLSGQVREDSSVREPSFVNLASNHLFEQGYFGFSRRITPVVRLIFTLFYPLELV